MEIISFRLFRTPKEAYTQRIFRCFLLVLNIGIHFHFFIYLSMFFFRVLNMIQFHYLIQIFAPSYSKKKCTNKVIMYEKNRNIKKNTELPKKCFEIPSTT